MWRSKNSYRIAMLQVDVPKGLEFVVKAKCPDSLKTVLAHRSTRSSDISRAFYLTCASSSSLFAIFMESGLIRPFMTRQGIIVAAKHNNVKVIQDAVEKFGFNCRATFEKALAISAERGYAESISCLKQVLSPNEPIANPQLLQYATSSGHEAVVTELIQDGHDVNVWKGTALLMACTDSEWDIVDELLEAGAVPQVSLGGWDKAFTNAVCSGHLLVTQLCLRAGVSPGLIRPHMVRYLRRCGFFDIIRELHLHHSPMS